MIKFIILVSKIITVVRSDVIKLVPVCDNECKKNQLLATYYIKNSNKNAAPQNPSLSIYPGIPAVQYSNDPYANAFLNPIKFSPDIISQEEKGFAVVKSPRATVTKQVMQPPAPVVTPKIITASIGTASAVTAGIATGIPVSVQPVRVIPVHKKVVSAIPIKTLIKTVTIQPVKPATVTKTVVQEPTVSALPVMAPSYNINYPTLGYNMYQKPFIPQYGANPYQNYSAMPWGYPQPIFISPPQYNYSTPKNLNLINKLTKKISDLYSLLLKNIPHVKPSSIIPQAFQPIIPQQQNKPTTVTKQVPAQPINIPQQQNKPATITVTKQVPAQPINIPRPQNKPATITVTKQVPAQPVITAPQYMPPFAQKPTTVTVTKQAVNPPQQTKSKKPSTKTVNVPVKPGKLNVVVDKNGKKCVAGTINAPIADLTEALKPCEEEPEKEDSSESSQISSSDIEELRPPREDLPPYVIKKGKNPKKDEKENKSNNNCNPMLQLSCKCVVLEGYVTKNACFQGPDIGDALRYKNMPPYNDQVIFLSDLII